MFTAALFTLAKIYIEATQVPISIEIKSCGTYTKEIKNNKDKNESTVLSEMGQRQVPHVESKEKN